MVGMKGEIESIYEGVDACSKMAGLMIDLFSVIYYSIPQPQKTS
jgi:hypothetical protein